jgi:IclR family KDG regulon transcriptional repressor
MAVADLDKQPDSVSSVLKVFGILQALGEEREIGITELSQRVMMSKSTVYRFLQTMKSLGYVAQEGESEKYSLTLKLFELGARALQNVDLVRSADIQMRELSRLTKETIHLGALDEDSIVYIHKIDSMYNLRMYSRIGRPLYSTAIGKVLLAWRDRAEVEQILEGVEYKRSTERTITSTEALLDVLDQVRQQGYGEDNEEQEEGCAASAYRFSTALAW